MSASDRPGAESPGEAERRRRAEAVAGRFLDDPDPAALEDETPLDEPGCTLFVEHLFVHGLLSYLADETQPRWAAARERRVQAVMARIHPGGRAAVRVGRAEVRRRVRYVAAAVLAGILVFAGLLLVLDRGIESEAAIDRALIHIRKGLDLQYRGGWRLEFDVGGRTVQRRFAAEFITGIDRFYMAFELVVPDLGPVPVYLGRKGKLAWFQFGPFGPFDVTEPGARSRSGLGDPRELMTALDSMLERMRSFARLELTEPEEGVLRISGRPRDGGEAPFTMFDHLVIDLDRETYEVKTFEVDLKPERLSDLPLEMMMQGMDLPEGAKLKAIGFRMKLVKAYRAPAEIYVPEALQEQGDDGPAEGPPREK